MDNKTICCLTEWYQRNEKHVNCNMGVDVGQRHEPLV